MFKDFQGEIKSFLFLVFVIVFLAAIWFAVSEVRQSFPIPEQSPQPVQQLPPPAPSPLPPPVEEPNIPGNWIVYQNNEYGFEVAYPPQENSQCVFREVSEGAFALGRIDVAVIDSEGLEFDEYMEQFVATRTAEPYSWTIETQESTVLDGKKGVSLGYRFGGLNRYAAAVFAEHDGKIFVVDYSAGAFLCNEPELYPQILSTFRFTP